MRNRNSDLATMVYHLAEGSNALREFIRMPRDELKQLIDLLSDPGAVAALRATLVAALDMQGNSKSSSSATPSKSSKKLASDDFDLALRDLFSDREKFPTVSSISKFSRDVFGVNIPYAKKARDRYIRDIARAVSTNPKALFYARNVLGKKKNLQKDEAYKLLYGFIRGRLS